MDNKPVDTVALDDTDSAFNKVATTVMKDIFAINPKQQEQFESALGFLLRVMHVAAPEHMFAQDEKGAYTDPYTAVGYQLWLNAKLNHMLDWSRALELQQATEDSAATDATKIH